nr:immunoglobulin light chain junction region [Macaca mulatta]MOY15743.1 immunoglobulin light chain junction region [Macaca mulatta]MOY16904.1 immunoglobulin light chain junction region [Macaca mulatta]
DYYCCSYTTGSTFLF